MSCVPPRGGAAPGVATKAPVVAGAGEGALAGATGAPGRWVGSTTAGAGAAASGVGVVSATGSTGTVDDAPGAGVGAGAGAGGGPGSGIKSGAGGVDDSGLGATPPVRGPGAGGTGGASRISKPWKIMLSGFCDAESVARM